MNHGDVVGLACLMAAGAVADSQFESQSPHAMLMMEFRIVRVISQMDCDHEASFHLVDVSMFMNSGVSCGLAAILSLATIVCIVLDVPTPILLP